MRTSSLLQAFALAAGMALSIGAVAERQAGASIAIDADDLGGVVTGPKGPEAGVWVIAETTDLPTDSRGSSSPTIAAAMCSPICRRRPTTSGCAATAWSIRRRSRARPARSLNLTAVAGAGRARGRAVLSGRLLVLADEGAGQE